MTPDLLTRARTEADRLAGTPTGALLDEVRNALERERRLRGLNRPRPLTPTQARVKAYLRAYVARHGYAPTLGELCAAFGWRAESTAHEMIGTLVGKGHLRRCAKAARGIALVEES